MQRKREQSKNHQDPKKILVYIFRRDARQWHIYIQLQGKQASCIGSNMQLKSQNN